MQQQLIFPLLQALDANGGDAKPSELYEQVANAVGITPEVRGETVEYAGQRFNRWARDVRWAKQRAQLEGLIDTPRRGQWKLTGKGARALREAKPGVAITIFVTDAGVAMWGRAEDCMRYLDDGSVNLFLTSPPYPINTRKRAYGNLDADAHVSWLTHLVGLMVEKTADDGSIVLNMGDCWDKGSPTLSLYPERLLIRLVDELGLHLLQRFEWFNPGAMPGPALYTNQQRVRVKNALERVYWLSPNPAAKAANANVLVPYSDRMQAVLRAGGQPAAKRPSGHTLAQGAFSKDNGGAIPPNLISAANTTSNDSYLRACKKHGLPKHPARFPRAVPEFFVRFLTVEDDLVADPCGGSLMTGAVAEDLGRRWWSCDTMLDYLHGGQHRFERAA